MVGLSAVNGHQAELSARLIHGNMAKGQRKRIAREDPNAQGGLEHGALRDSDPEKLQVGK